MSKELSPIETAKMIAARRAVDFIEDGMRVGLGTGSTVIWMVRRLGELIRNESLNVIAVPTSKRTAVLARDEGITVASLDEARWLDLTIDGADEVDSRLNLIKGGGGAHLREKIVARASDRMIVIADASKEVQTLGAFPLPLEVLEFGLGATQRLVAELLAGQDVLGDEITLRMSGKTPYVTDEGNRILDLHLKRIDDPRKLASELNQIPGVVENGLFVDICDTAIFGHADGLIRIRDGHSRTTREERVGDLGLDNLFSDI